MHPYQVGILDNQVGDADSKGGMTSPYFGPIPDMGPEEAFAFGRYSRLGIPRGSGMNDYGNPRRPGWQDGNRIVPNEPDRRDKSGVIC